MNIAPPTAKMMDANEAVARVAYATNEVIAIYPITPASPMGEFADAWSAQDKPNILGTIPHVIEMQSEGGAAGAVHGALQAGALTTTFTASQGLLLMIPNMYKIAGELTPTVFHVAARTVATHALSIFGDHSDVMAVRQCGWGMLCAASVQEAHDFALIAQAAALRSRIPIVHFFDGFRTSHEVNRVEVLTDAVIQELLDIDAVRRHRDRAMDPERPVLRGSAQNPDVFFQAREAANPFYAAAPAVVQDIMRTFQELTGREYHLFDYVGSPAAERVIVMMGSGCGAARLAVEDLTRRGERVGLLTVRLFRPFAVDQFAQCLPASTRSIAVLDRTKEPGSIGEPLYQDVLTALHEGWEQEKKTPVPRVIGGRYGLASKEFTPSMVASILRELDAAQPRRHFTIGIVDDVSHTSLPWTPDEITEPADVTRALFYGLGSDGTVSANKNTVKIIGEHTPLFAQGYFVYDSKKAGSVTISHLRFSPRPIDAPYLIDAADFVACHHADLLFTMDVLGAAQDNGTFLLNSPYPPDQVWDTLPREVQDHIVRKRLRFFVIDAYKIATESGLGRRINTVMQTCFFALINLLPAEEAMGYIKTSIRRTYANKGETMVRKNDAAVDATLAGLAAVSVPDQVTSVLQKALAVPAEAPSFVQRVTALMISGHGNLLPVSALPVDGTFPTGTSQYEKRSIAQEIPIWDPDICIECGLCALVCPHAAIRSKVFAMADERPAPADFRWRPWSDTKPAEATDTSYVLTIQVAPDDCTGCGVCVDICPAKSKEVVRHKAINMEPKLEHLTQERANFDYFIERPSFDRTQIKTETVKGSQLLQPLFEYSGACAGCGETPYLKLLSQLFGDRMVVANATGCSSIYGGNLPTTPWSQDAQGRGPAWSNSLFEDNAEFGLGIRLGLDHKESEARHLLKALSASLDGDLIHALLSSPQQTEADVSKQRARVAQLKECLRPLDSDLAKRLLAVADVLVRRAVWIVGGDGWAYDIGFGGLDHVLASGHDVNVLVLDTGVYSNTGGQASKATPRAAIAKYASGGKSTRKKDLGMLAVSYGNVYVAQIAVAANPAQTLRTFQEATSYHGPSLILAYSHCIAHGIDMTTSFTHQKDATKSGFWPLYHYDPRLAHQGMQPFHLDSRKPTMRFKDFAMQEARFAMLAHASPENSERLLQLAQQDIDDQWHYYEQMAGVEREMPVAEKP